MKLQVPFLQLPVSFDAAALAAEIAGIEESLWREHPNRLAGNSALTLVTTGGDPDSDELSGEMRPTPVLARLPQVRRVLGALGATWGRSRLMRLSGLAEVTAHVDTNYYWRERMRVHVPITTTPDVRFQAGDAETHMRAGECWIFDTWRRHRVVNNADSTRIHLVADTVGGDGLWKLIAGGKPHDRAVPGWTARPVALDGEEPDLHFEAVNLAKVMTPWEVKDHFVFLLGEAVPHPALPGVQQALLDFARRWQAAWSRFGEDLAGAPVYRALLHEGRADVVARGADVIGLRNEIGLLFMLDSLVFDSALAGAGGAAARKDVHGGMALPVGGPSGPTLPAKSLRAEGPPARSDGAAVRVDATRFEHPVFIVSPPRSGSTLLFETLVGAPGVYTIGDESHMLIEGVPGLAPSQRGHESNRLLAADADDATAAMLRARFLAALHDRDGAPPPAVGPLRMLEKTPKNALRIPFLRRVFPGARFLYLHRDPRQVLGSMIDGWQSGNFVMYPHLPGWQGLPWSFLLTPGWRALSARPLAEIVCAQWETATRLLLDDLDALAPDEWTAIDHDRFVADPTGEVRRVCDWAGWQWDRPLGALPLSKYTLTPPDPEKWRRYEAVLAPLLPALEETMVRARAAVARKG